MPAKLTRQRRNAFRQQAGRCFYCGFQMWASDLEAFAARYNLSLKLANRLQCTGEHLHPRQEGGSSAGLNIVAACRFCNETRHRRRQPPAPATFKQQVQARVSSGRWHAREIWRALTASGVDSRLEGCTRAGIIGDRPPFPPAVILFGTVRVCRTASHLVDKLSDLRGHQEAGK